MCQHRNLKNFAIIAQMKILSMLFGLSNVLQP